LVVLVTCLGACDDDDLVTDAGVDIMAERPADAVIDRPADVAIEIDARDVPAEVESAPDLQGGGDCPYELCVGNEAVFTVRDFFRRFGTEAHDVEVTACRGDACGSARVLTHPNSRTTVTNHDAVDGGYVWFAGASTDLRVQLRLDWWQPLGRARSEDVSFRVLATGTGRLLVEYRDRLPVEVYCPGGLRCRLCEQITVEIDLADGGRPIDAHSPPGPDELCQ
jgi:hypothetical protein